MTKDTIVAAALACPLHAVVRTVMEGLRTMYPGRYIAQPSYPDDAQIIKFLEKTNRPAELAPDFGQDHTVAVYRRHASAMESTGWYRFELDGVPFEMLTLALKESHGSCSETFLISPSEKDALNLIQRVADWNRHQSRTVHVFSDGRFHADHDLEKDIRTYTFDNLILPGTTRDDIRDDLSLWIGAREQYERYGIPWKRGMIFIGPPGNGKTHTIKAILNEFGMRAIYVRSFKAQYVTPERTVETMFEFAREIAPCIVVLEDLDTLVTPEIRSFFLNELDGFARNQGILCLATANDASKLDPALVDRPSRFDRKVNFALPEVGERSRFLQSFSANLDPTLRLNIIEADEIADITEDFSFAYLKELLLSAMMIWIARPQEGTFASVVANAAPALSAQLSEPIHDIWSSDSDDDDYMDYFADDDDEDDED